MILRTSTSRQLSRASVLGAACALLAACSSSPDTAGTERLPDESLPALGEARLRLERAESCDDLLTRIQDSILVQLAERAEQLRSAGGVGYWGTEDVAVGGGPVAGAPAPSAEVDEGAAGAPPSGSSAADPIASPIDRSAGEESADSGSGGFSGTTVQVEEVDEADIVKTDGDNIYLLHGGTLFVLAGWPANATELTGSILLEGEPAEMFVEDGKAVVFSRVYGDLSAAAQADSAPYRQGYTSHTKISVVDVSGAQPELLRESFVEGDYTSARRHGSVVRAVIQDGLKVPSLGNANVEYFDPFGNPLEQADIDAQVDAWLDRTTRAVRSTDLGDWLPREYERRGAQLEPVAPRCADHYSPDPGLTETGVTSVVALDLAAPTAPLSGATILGRAERVYSNEDVLLVTQTDWRWQWDEANPQQTVIHRFDIAGADTSYTASGAVAGSIHDQFSLDEQDGIIRVSTTEDAFWRGVVDLPAIEPGVASVPLPPPQPTSISRVLTLETRGDELAVLGATDGFGENERIFSTRFIGDRGYVVTFRQTDPLFVIDLADPAAPQVVGELHIPGFSNFLFPLDEGHLFAIGRDATEEGVVQGLALQIFDVTDPANPRRSQLYVYPDAGDSPANIDHRAITFHPERDVVAFPHRSYTTGESTLEVFELSTEAGFTRIGGMAAAAEIDLEQCLAWYFGYPPGTLPEELRAEVASQPDWEREVLASCGGWQYFRRGLFREDFVYGVSNTGVSVYSLEEMAAGAVAEVSLPGEVYDSRGYGGGTSPGRPAPDFAPDEAPAPPPVQTEPAQTDPAQTQPAEAETEE